MGQQSRQKRERRRAKQLPSLIKRPSYASVDVVAMIKKSIERWRGFPNTSEYAHYDFMTQTIVLSSVNAKQFQQAIDSNDPELILKLNKTLIHEVAHYVDHVATVWGQESLRTLFDATNARVTESIDEYWRIANWFGDLRRLHYAEYYTHYSDYAFREPTYPWRPTLSVGVQFGADGRAKEDAPIPFMKFEDFHGTYICRVPFSIASLLEVNAVASEIVLDTQYLMMQSSDDQIVSLSVLRQHYLQFITNPFLAEYTVAAHHVGNSLGLTDIFEAFATASIISTIALNVPSDAFDNLVVPIPFAMSFGDRNEAFKKRRDRGYLFLCLVEHARRISFKSIASDFDVLLKICGLPSVNDLKTCSTTLSNGQGGFNGPASVRLDKLLGRGKRIAELVGSFGGPSRISAIAKLITNQPELLPYTFLGDNSLIIRESREIEEAKKWVNESFRDQNQLREFVNACLPS